MATLTVTNTYIAGTLAKASEVNQNFTDIINWGNGNIQNDNIGTLNGAINWSIVTGLKAIDISNSGNEGSIEVTQSTALNPNKAGLKIEHTAAETSGDACVFIDVTSSSTAIPALRIDDIGAAATGRTPSLLVNSTTRGVKFSEMTETNRDNINNPVEGEIIYNNAATVKSYQVYDGERWQNIGASAGDVKMSARSAPEDGWLLCDGSAISRTTYAKLFAAIGTTFGVGDGSTTFNLPDPRSRSPIAVGQGSSLTNKTLNEKAGAETVVLTEGQMPQHNHSVSNSTGIQTANHAHRMFTNNDSGGPGTVISGAGDRVTKSRTDGGGGASFNYAMISDGSSAGVTVGTTGIEDNSHTHTFAATSTMKGSSQGHNNMHPYIGFNFFIKT